MAQALRGDLSQKEMSLRIGHNFNQWHKFESGQKIMTWEDFEKITLTFDIPLHQILKEIFHFDINSSETQGMILWPLWHQLTSGSDRDACEYFGISKNTWARMTEGGQKIPLSMIFAIFYEFTDQMPYFYEAITKEKFYSLNIPELKNQRNLFLLISKMPEASLIMAALETMDYKKRAEHDDEFLAKKCGISLVTVSKCMEQLIANELIYKNHHKYYSNISLHGVYQKSPPSLSSFWLQRGFNENLKQHKIQVVPLSENGLAEIQEKVGRLFFEINKIAKKDSSEEKNKIHTFIFQQFDIE